MRRLGKTDSEQAFLMAPGEHPPTVATFFCRQLDARGRYMIQMVQAWGQMALLNDGLADMHDEHCDAAAEGEPKKKRRTPSKQEIVLLAAEMVEATFDEAQRRGWILEIPLGEDGEI